MKLVLYRVLVVVTLWTFQVSLVNAHKGKDHKPPSASDSPAPSASEPKPDLRLQKINAIYIAKVKPVFQKKCFDCHSSQTRFPWYHKLPGIRGWIERDIKEALEHLDFSSDYPFAGHGSLSEDLDAVWEITENNSMPPLRYRIMHPGSALNAHESQQIQEWVVESRGILEQTNQ